MNILNSAPLASEYVSQENRLQYNELAAENQKARSGSLDSAKAASGVQRTVAQGGNASAERDVVTLSEKARQLSRDEDGVNTLPGAIAAGLRGTEDSEESGSAGVDAVLKQIRDVKEKLQDAENRLAEANAKATREVPPGKTAVTFQESLLGSTNNGGSGYAGRETAATAASGTFTQTASMSMPGKSTEIQSIQEEISQLNQQLQVLYQQLQELQKQG